MAADSEPHKKSYRVKVSMTNLDTSRMLHVMQTPIRAFVQTGTVWREVPAKAADGEFASGMRRAPSLDCTNYGRQVDERSGPRCATPPVVCPTAAARDLGVRSPLRLTE